MHRLLHRILLFLALLLTGCAEEPVLLLQDWTLELPGNPTAIHLPTHVDGLLPNEPSTYTLSTRVSLPPAYQGKELTFAVPFLPGRSSLRVNSVPAKFLEEIDPEDYRFPNPHLFWIPPDQTQKGELRLQLQVLMKSPWGAWLDTVPRLSATERGDRYVRAMRSWNLWANVLGMCGITVTALTHLCLFLWTREFRNRGFALVYGLTVAFPLFCLGYMQRLFGTAEAFVMGFDLVAVCMAAVHLALVVEGFQKVGKYCVGVALMTGAIYAPVINPFRGLRSGTYAVIAIVITVVVVFVWLLAKNRKRRTTPALDAPSLTVDRMAFPLGVFCGLPDVLVFAGHGQWVGCWRTATFGMGIAAVVSTIGLSIQYFESRKRSILLQQSLEDRVLLLESNSKEIQALNGELRRQLAANAAELATALVRASKTGSVRQLELGEVVEGRYRVVGHLGSGGMGTVYEVERLTDQHHFAMKLLLGNYSPVSIARLAREAESALRVQCPSVVEVRDVGITDFGMLFIVMDLVEGPSLSEESSRYGDFPWAIRILSQVAEGLGAIHRAGVVHRDIKPRNILLSYEGDPRHPKAQIADFGVAALGFEASEPGDTPFDDHALTRTGSLVGTPLYMAPEVHGRGGDVGFPSDIFSFGVLAREVLALDTGTLGVPLGLMLAARADYMPSPVFQSCPALGEELGTLLDRCILLRMEDRPTADELHEALDRLRVSATEVAAPLQGECA